MEEMFSSKPQKRGINKVLIVATVFAVVLIGVVIWLLSRKPSMEEQTAKILQTAIKPGDKGFDDLSKDIIISTDDKTIQSPTGLGTISMFISGNIRNKGEKTIDILEVNVAVITQFNQVLQERRMLVVPVQQSSLGPGATIPITLNMAGFSPNDDRANIRWRVTAIKAE